MSDSELIKASTRSDKRIPKLRTRGRANRTRLLAEAQRLIERKSGEPLRFSEVFEAANVSRGSAYRIYNGIDDLMQDLASTWINNFVAYIRAASEDIVTDSWTELSDLVVKKSADYWIETAETLRVLPRVRSNVPESYRQAVKDLTLAISEIFDRHYEVPQISDWLSVIAMYVQLCDTIFADAVRRDGQISEQRLTEAQKIGSTYLSFYLPSWLAARKT